MKMNMDKSEIWNNPPQGSTLKFSLIDTSITAPKTANAKPREREREREWWCGRTHRRGSSWP